MPQGGRPRTGSVWRAKLPNGRPDTKAPWWCRITMPDGTRTNAYEIPDSVGWSEEKARQYAGNKTEEAATRNLTAARAKGPRTKPDTIADIVERWEPIVAASDLKRATKAQHRSNGKTISKKFGPLRPEQLTTPVLRAWLREFRNDLSASRVRNVFFSLSKMLDAANGEGWYAGGNPCRSSLVLEELPASHAPRDDEKARHTETEATRLLLSPALPRERAMRYLLAFTSGMLDGELAALRWSSLATVHGVDLLRVTSSIDPTGERDDPKTDARKRTVPVHPLTARALAWWKREGWKAYVGRDPKPSDPLLPGSDGKAWRIGTMAEVFRSDLEAAGMPTVWTSDDGEEEPYQLRSTRRSFSTWLDAHGVAADIKDRLMRHKEQTVRGRHYEAETPEKVSRLASAVATITLTIDAAPWLDPEVVSSGESSCAHEEGPPSEGPSIGIDSEVRTGFEPAYDGFASHTEDLGAHIPPASAHVPTLDASASGGANPATLRRETKAEDASIDVVETALARALTGATEAGRWDVVAQIARELEARRLGRETNVVPLDAERRRGRG